MNTTRATTLRRTIGMSGVLLALAIAVLFGIVLVPDGAAKTKTKVPIAERVHTQIHNCADLGGTATVTTTPFGAAVTTCTGGALDGTTCVNTKKSINCTDSTTRPADPAGGQPILPAVEPSHISDQPLVAASLGGDLTADDGDQHDEGKHHGKRKHHRRGGRSR